ncbi:phosphoglucomutase [Veillonella agrestimuris]|uniref:phosphoglucomutase n=1 Tax=Veillonella agrestimuris TaxID=2941340 RepID=UPI00203DFF75|nr:phosphoglucomutase [Veillonella agrestimuris]
MAHELAGRPVLEQDVIDIQPLVDAYFDNVPDMSDPTQLVSFGTSGHRGTSLNGTFTDLHVAAITQAICDGRRQFGATGPVFVGQDTHALSQPAMITVLEVLAGNGITAMVDSNMDFVPTPSMSRAIIRYNESHDEKADGIIITPSHNPPDNGGIKYNTIIGGPADTIVTKWIEVRANEYLTAYCEHDEFKRISIDNIEPTAQVPYDFKGLYVEELDDVINMEAIKASNIRVLVDALGGSGAKYWTAIKERYGLNLDIIHDDYDPTFSFMTYDHDGKVRMDCSSPHAMAAVIDQIGHYDIAVGNDPDYDRYGIVVKEDGLISANEMLAVGAKYLFTTRGWKDKGVGKTVVCTTLIDKWAESVGIPVYEVPVGFKYFAQLLFDGTIGIGGEESAGASFLKKDGSVWTTDKDGIIMALLGMEIRAVMGTTGLKMADEFLAQYGEPKFGRIDAACTTLQKQALKKLDATAITATEVDGDEITSIRTTSLYNDMPIDGVRVDTEQGWFVARPSGTEDLYKIYGESYKGEHGLVALLTAGEEIVNAALANDEE